MSLVDPLRAALSASGLNAFGVVDVATWDAAVGPERRSAALLPGARAILVVGSGGGAFWEAFLADLRRDPRGLTEEQHPLDAFAQRAVLAADPLLGDVRRRWFWCGATADVHLDFRQLAHFAGLGARSRLGLLMHPVWGPWLGLRAACLLDADLPASEPGGPDLCAGCPAPCVSACPGGAFPDAADPRWNVDRCGAFKLSSNVCRSSCASRCACPVGAEHRYPDAEMAYHTHRETGRRWLREHLGIPDGVDRFEGEGPYWGSWRERVNVKGG